MSSNRKYKVIISGGGTGGHIYPAIAIANGLKEKYENIDILFVGASDRMEMEKVPKAGYRIIGLWISGIQRRITFSNLLFPLKLISSVIKSFSIVRSFKPDVAVGVGGYASGALLYAAASSKVPTLIQEQNSFAGITNKWLAGKVNKICVAYDAMERFFPKNKIIKTGNPVRSDINNLEGKRSASAQFFGLDPNKIIVLVIGGSLGARTINQSLKKSIHQFIEKDIQVIWQTGQGYYDDVKDVTTSSLVTIKPFIYEMSHAYAAADVVVSRAGALSISEICNAHKASVLVPSPNVTEDHQTKNAMSLVKENAALLVKDIDAQENLVNEVIELVNDKNRLKELQANVANLARPNALNDIVEEVSKLMLKS